MSKKKTLNLLPRDDFFGLHIEKEAKENETFLFDTLPGESDRDKIIYILLKLRLSNTRISKALNISERTIRRTCENGF